MPSVVSGAHSTGSGRTRSERVDHYPPEIGPLRSPHSSSGRSLSESQSSNDWSIEDDIGPSESASRPGQYSRSRHSSSRHSSSRHSTSRHGSHVAERTDSLRPEIKVAAIEEQRFTSTRPKSHSRSHSVAHSAARSVRSVAPSARNVEEAFEAEREYSTHGERRERHRDRGHSIRHRDSSDESSSLEYHDERLSYSRHDAPRHHSHRPPHPSEPWGQPSGYANYPHSMSGSHGHHPSYATGMLPNDALVHMPRPDGFGSYPQHNPFAQPSSSSHHHGNPFSPMSTGSASTGYFSHDPYAPPPQASHPAHRPGMGSYRPASYASASGGTYASEQMSPYYGGHAGGHPSGHYAVPPGMHAYMYPPQPSPAPPPAPTSSKEKERDPRDEELAKMRAVLKQIEEEKIAIEAQKIAAEKARMAQMEAERAAWQKQLILEAEERKRKEELGEATKKAKEAAEQAAAEKAKKAKEDSDKIIAEAKKKMEEAEAAKKKLEEEAKKNKPGPDEGKPPIKFKDAVGRKFSFPWRVCKTWKGMESLIKQAFMQVDMVGAHVMEGHYDLLGPDGEIILPQVWESTVAPGWEISMHMWPMPEPPKHDDAAFLAMMDGMKLDDGKAGHRRKNSRRISTKDSKKKNRMSGVPMEHIINVDPGPPTGHGGMPSGGLFGAFPAGMMPPAPPPPPGAMPGMMPPPPPHHGPFDGGMMPPPPPLDPIFAVPHKSKATKNTKAKRKELPALAAWMVGARPRRS